jgi:hypothetical protein
MNVLQLLIKNINPKAMKVEPILLHTHYKYAKFSTLSDLKAIVDGDPITSKLLMDNVPSTMALVSTTYSFVRDRLIWKGLSCECLILNRFNCRVCFQIVICVYDRKIFS